VKTTKWLSNDGALVATYTERSDSVFRKQPTVHIKFHGTEMFNSDYNRALDFAMFDTYIVKMIERYEALVADLKSPRAVS